MPLFHFVQAVDSDRSIILALKIVKHSLKHIDCSKKAPDRASSKA